MEMNIYYHLETGINYLFPLSKVEINIYFYFESGNNSKVEINSGNNKAKVEIIHVGIVHSIAT